MNNSNYSEEARRNILETQRSINALRATEEAAALIRSGISIYQMSELGDDDHIVFLTLLASGFERFMKSILILRALDVDKKPLTKADMLTFQHHLTTLKDEVIDKCFTPTYLSRPLAKADYDFIKNDQDFKDMLAILDDFADARSESGRYIFIDGATDPASTSGEWPERRWEELEYRKIANEECLKDSFLAKRKAVTNTVILLERFTRALYNVLVFADTPSKAVSIAQSVQFRSFKRLSDDQLGKRVHPIKIRE